MIACTGDGRSRMLIPLFSQAQDECLIGTGLCLADSDEPFAHTHRGGVCLCDLGSGSAAEAVRDRFSLDSPAMPIGLVCEGSQIGKVKFDTWAAGACKEGQLVFCRVGGQRVFYQIVEGNTREEILAKHTHGFQVAESTQLGVLEKAKGFVKFPWLPGINTPVFSATGQTFPELPEPGKGEFVIGTVPG